jgi:aspartyl-tRNA(Asn)/glutamyl-tRNA(Gln) amidotransferase subunit C
MRITTEEVRHIALLARVGMTEEEVERMRDQMSHILDSIDVLGQVDTEGVEPTGHSANLESVMRDDEVTDSRPLEDVLANAPRREGDFVRVRAVLE